MPRQETFFEEWAGNRRIEVIKTYDHHYAREVFGAMDSDALKVLAAALDVDSNYDSADIPDPDGPDYEDFLWEELLKAGLEDVHLDSDLRSFFVVACNDADSKTRELYVSADWPSAEGFAKRLLALPV